MRSTKTTGRFRALLQALAGVFSLSCGRGGGEGVVTGSAGGADARDRRLHPARDAREGSILVMVLWIVFGLISLTLYFAHSMSYELAATDNRVAGVEAEQAIEGARRYLSCLLSNVNSAGVLPELSTYPNQAVAVGNAHFWIIGRGPDTDPPTMMHFGLIDESSKININNAGSNVLLNLPRITPDQINNLLAWRSTNSTSLTGGAESPTYLSSASPYNAKNAPFETIEELRLVYQMDLPTLYGEDANLNGVLDPNENDGDLLPPSDNVDGKLDPGLLEYCTVYSIEPTTYTATNGGVATNLTRLNLATANAASLTGILTSNGISATRASAIVAKVGGTRLTSPMQFYYTGGLSPTEFMQIETAIRGTNIAGLVNVNTASTAVLNCLPGLTNGVAAQLTAYRSANSNSIYAQGVSMVWITQVLSQTEVLAAAPYITGHGYQFMADIAAVGHNGRGYRRTRFVFDTSQGRPVVIYRKDLSSLGWALGKDVRDKWLLAKQ